MHATNADAKPRRAISSRVRDCSPGFASALIAHEHGKVSKRTTDRISLHDPPIECSIPEETITIDCDADLIVLGPQHKLLATAVAGPAQKAARALISPVKGLLADAAPGTSTKATKANKIAQAAKAAQADKTMADNAAQAAKATQAVKAGTATRAAKAAQAKAAAAAARAVAFAANEAVLAALAAADTEGEAGEEETPRETDEQEEAELEGEESASSTDYDGESEAEGEALGEA
jgi:hypothetical protein